MSCRCRADVRSRSDFLISQLSFRERVVLLCLGSWNRLLDRPIRLNLGPFEPKLGELDRLFRPFEHDLFRLFGQIILLVHLLELREFLHRVLERCPRRLQVELGGHLIALAIHLHKIVVVLLCVLASPLGGCFINRLCFQKLFVAGTRHPPASAWRVADRFQPL